MLRVCINRNRNICTEYQKTQDTFRLKKLLMAEYLKLFMIYIYIAYQEIFYVIDNLDEMPFILQYNQITKIVIDVSLNHNASYLSNPCPCCCLTV